MNFRHFAAGAVSMLVFIAVALGGFYIGKDGSSEGTSQVSTPTPQLIATSTPVPTNTSTPTPTNEEVLKQSIIDAVSSNNYADVLKYFDNTVEMRKEATECCGKISKAQAVEELTYIEDAEKPWIFDETSEIVTSLESSYPEYYSNSIIAVSNDGQLVAFQIDDGKVVSISMAANYKLLVP